MDVAISNRIKYVIGSIICALLIATPSGCARDSYQYGITRSLPTVMPTESSIRYGDPNPRMDKWEAFLFYPIDKIRERRNATRPNEISNLESNPIGVQSTSNAGLLSDGMLGSLESIDRVTEYLGENELQDVKVDIRVYDPAEQWRRLRANPNIAPVWKYTAGTLDHLRYRLIPDRLLRRDSFSIFTNTLSLNSNRTTRALFAAATAKTMHAKRFPGAFATSCYFPVVPLSRDIETGNDLLTYARVRGEWELEQEFYPEIYGTLGRNIMAESTSLIPQFAYFPFYVRPLVRIGGRVVGTMAGRQMVDRRRQERID